MTATRPLGAVTTSVTASDHLDPTAPPGGPRPRLALAEEPDVRHHLGLGDREAAGLQQGAQARVRTDGVRPNATGPLLSGLGELVGRDAEGWRRRRSRSSPLGELSSGLRRE